MGKFPALIAPKDPPKRSAIDLKEVRHQINERVFRFAKEDPNKAASSFVNNDEVCRESIKRLDNPISFGVGSRKIRSRRPGGSGVGYHQHV